MENVSTALSTLKVADFSSQGQFPLIIWMEVAAVKVNGILGEHHLGTISVIALPRRGTKSGR